MRDREFELTAERMKVEEAMKSLENAHQTRESQGTQAKALQEQLAWSQQTTSNQETRITQLESCVHSLEGEKRELLGQNEKLQTSSTNLAKE